MRVPEATTAADAIVVAGSTGESPTLTRKERAELYRAVGCTNCSKTGYKGRLALHEVMLVTEEIERLAVEKASATTIEKVAREQGMKTLREDGLTKVLAGVTSLDEILRVVV